jgi:hypothetical protein
MAIPNDAKEELMNGTFDLANDTIKVGLLDTSTAYTFDPDADEFVSNLPTGAEPGDASYSRQTLSSKTVSEDTADDEGVWDAADVTFGSLTTTNDIQTIFVYKQVGTDDSTPGDDPLIVIWDDDSGDGGGIADLPISTNGSDLTITFDAEGILNIQ